jgi:hypothetical protein
VSIQQRGHKTNKKQSTGRYRAVFSALSGIFAENSAVFNHHDDLGFQGSIDVSKENGLYCSNDTASNRTASTASLIVYE